jgi:hypothetical protein
MNCIHGLDSRFCAACNKAGRSGGTRSGAGGPSLADILRFLNDAQIRATYGAVAEVLGVVPRSLGALLGDRRPEASWIVAGANGLPTGYSQDEWHPALLNRGEIIGSGRELLLRMAASTPPKARRP